MKQKLKNIYNALLFKIEYFIWKHNRSNTSIKKFTNERYSKTLIKQSAKFITRQHLSPDPPTEMSSKNYQFIGVIPDNWLEKIDKRIEETKPDWVDKVEQLKAAEKEKNS